MRRISLAGTVMSALLMLLVGTSQAQNFGEAGLSTDHAVTAMGTAVIERQAQRVRMQIELQGKGKDIKAALAKLEKRREAASSRLKELGVIESTIEYGQPKTDASISARQRQMLEMVMSNQRGVAKRRAQKLFSSQPIVVSQSLQAEWPIHAEDTAELLIFCHELENTIRDADVAGTKEPEELSAEEEELLEEMKESANQFGGYSESEGPKPGTPSFLYVARIDENEHAQALARAFSKAKAQASTLAKAAGVELGTLRRLAAQEQSASIDNYDEYGGYAYQRFAYMQMQRAAGTAQEGSHKEAIGSAPGQIKYQIVVRAAFGIKASRRP